jgi:hypothetical protein
MPRPDDDDDAHELEALRWIRTRIDHEDDLIAHRTTWVVGSQAFLCSAYAICAAGLRAAEGVQIHKLALLQSLLPWAALLSLLSLFISILSALASMWRLRRLATPDDELSRVVIWGHPALRLAGAAASIVIPLLFLAIWIAILMQH